MGERVRFWLKFKVLLPLMTAIDFKILLPILDALRIREQPPALTVRGRFYRAAARARLLCVYKVLLPSMRAIHRIRDKQRKGNHAGKRQKG